MSLSIVVYLYLPEKIGIFCIKICYVVTAVSQAMIQINAIYKDIKFPDRIQQDVVNSQYESRK